MPSALATVRTRIDVPLTEEFVGEFDYNRFTLLQTQTDNATMGNAEGSGYPWGLYTQKHVDIRTFVSNDTQYSENWSFTGTPTTFQLGPEVYLNNWSAMVTNVLGVVTYLSTTERALDLTQLGADANVILALPNFQLVYIDPATSFLEFSSDDFETFTSVLFDQSTTTLVTNTDSVATWPMGLIESTNTGTDLTSVTGVRIRVQTYDETTLILTALRLVGPDWVPANVDIDNWNGALRQCIPPNAARGGFPVPSNRQLGTLWYAAPTTGLDDPQPINATMGVLFNTGSMLFSNSFGVSMRAVGGTDVSQLELNGKPQALLEGPQPSLSTSAELPRAISDLQGLSMDRLSGQTVFNLSARQANVAESWINFGLVWGAGIPSIGVTRSDTGQGYTWTGTATGNIAHLSPDTFYLCLVSINDVTARMQVLNVDQDDFQVIQPWNLGVVFDTGPLQDSYLFPRRKGRIGFNVNLLDGDAQVRAVRPHALSYAEWLTIPIQSNTPVNGARLYASYAPHEQLWTGWSAQPGQHGTAPLLNADTSRTTSGSSTKVTVQDASSLDQGIISNILTPADNSLAGIIDWANSQIDFDVWFPATGLQNPLSAYLLSQDGAQIPLVLPAIAPGTWQTITCYPPGVPPQYLSVMQSGRYQLVLIYEGTEALSFWIDNVRVIERTVTWDARANSTDPWVSFGDLISSDDAGVLFSKGTQLQVRGIAHRQDDVVLSPPQVIPRYARLGRMVWPEEQVADYYSTISPYVSISGSTHGSPVTFDASKSIAYPDVNSPNNAVANGDFAQGTLNWTTGGGNTLTQVPTPAYSGDSAIQTTYGGNSSLLIYSPSPAWSSINDQQQVVTLVAQVYIPSGWGGSAVRITNTTVEGAPTISKVLNQVTSNNGLDNQWQTIWTTYYYTSISADSGRAPQIRVASATASQFVYVDNVTYLIGDGRTGIANYIWNFGDGTVGTGAITDHTYAVAGQYNVSCVMTDTFGVSTIFNTIVSIA